jgi:hypothetical protein
VTVSRFWLLSVIALVLGSGGAFPAHAASGPAILTVHIVGGATKTSLRLQPGFATVLRSDRRIETVAIGDPRLVTATTVKRGQDVYDLVLQPQTTSGVTNMVVWFGDMTSIWDLFIGPGQRTADIVYVLTAPGPARSPTPASIRVTPESQIPTPSSWTPPSPAGPDSGPHADTQIDGSQPASGAPQFLEAQQVVGDAVGIFQVVRARDKVRVRYRITNKGSADFAIRPSGVLVRVNGRLVPFGMARESADRNRPAIVPPGKTEAGTINAPAPAPRQAEVIFSLFPVEEERQNPSKLLPLTFQLMFAGLDRLATSNVP